MFYLQKQSLKDVWDNIVLEILRNDNKLVKVYNP